MYSSLIIQTIQSAWRKPINIQDGLICDLRLTINKNGRVIKANLIRSSGNIRFDNSALKAVQRVETFNFFSKIPLSVYSSNFKNIVDSTSKSLPFGIAQIGKAFRNEITPRNFIFRVENLNKWNLNFL